MTDFAGLAVQPTDGGADELVLAHATHAPSQSLRAREERYRLVARATADLIWDLDLATGRVDWNEALVARYGYAPTEMVTQANWWEERIHEEDRERIVGSLHDVIAGDGDRFAGEYRFRKADGSYADIYDRGFLIRSADGTPLRMVGAMQDNSERNRAVAALRERESQLATVFGQAMVGIMHSSIDGTVKMVNARYCDILGRSEAEVRSCTFVDYTHPDDLTWNRPLYAAHARTGEPFRIEKRYVRPDGSTVWCDIAVSFVRAGDGSVDSAIVVVEDITARRAAEQALASQTSLLQNVIDSVADLIFVKDRGGRFILANRALDEGCGELVGLGTADFFPDDLVETYESVDQEVIRTGEHRCVEEIIPIKGEQKLFQTVKVPWVMNGETHGIIGVSRDITARNEAETALRKSEALHRSVLDASADCIMILDADGRIELINGPGRAIMEYDEETDLTRLSWSDFWPESERETAEAALDDARSGHPARFAGFCPTARGVPKYWDVVVTPISDEAGATVRLLSIARDITSVREVAEQLRQASELDALTNLPNRRSFQAHLQAATIRAMESNGNVGLILIDVDHFKHVNDTLGHAAGDHLLKTFAERLSASVRATDLVARLGGDEFAIVLEGIRSQDDVLRVGEAVAQRMKAPSNFDGRMVSGSVSMGGAMFPADASSAHELFKNADTALYALKGAGRGGTKMFHAHMREQAQMVASQLSLARTAISSQSVVPHYQPKIRLADGKLDGFEALLRWFHPRLGIQCPDTVAEAFKDYQLASHIGTVMQAKVVEDIKAWQARGLSFGRISINAAPAEFLRDDYAERLLDVLAKGGVAAELIEVEVTEHVFLERGSDFVARALSVLNEAGVRVALDDFGTGYSSLSHLRDFPVDVVKIDKSFIEKMNADSEIAAIVAAVIDLAHSLDIDVVGEGIETEAQRSFLTERGCTLGQGYLFGRAVAADEVALVRGWARAA